MQLPYGSRPYVLHLAPSHVVECAAPPSPRPLVDLLSHAVHASGGTLRDQRGPVTVIISDATRDEPRAEMLRILFAELPREARVTLAIATGTHGPSRPALPEDVLARCAVVVEHDGHRDADLVRLGTTPRGTPVRVHRCVLDAELVIATGCIRPHYFAGYSAGIKAIFPGLGAASDIRINHLLKADPMARAGITVGNPCREDMEDAVALVPTPIYLLNVIAGPDDQIHHAIAGEIATFDAGVALVRPMFTVPRITSPAVVASDALPVTASLYQASKIAAAVAPMVEAGGTLVIVAECAEGLGPVQIVNRAIYEIGIKPRLAAGVTVVLVSALEPALVRQSYATPARRVEDVISGPFVAVPRASQMIVE